TIYKLKFALIQTKPATYVFLKPYIQKRVDENVSIITERANFIYEATLSDELLMLIASQKDYNLSYKFYDAIIVDYYKNKLYSNLPKNHPLKISNQIIKYTLISSGILILLFVILNRLSKQSISEALLACILSIPIAIIAKKVYLFTVFVAF